MQTVNGGHHAALTLNAEELNILVARDPQYSSLRGKAYFAIAHSEIAAETNTLLNEHAPESQRMYFHGRVVFDASFSAAIYGRVAPPRTARRRTDAPDGRLGAQPAELFEQFQRRFQRKFPRQQPKEPRCRRFF